MQDTQDIFIETANNANAIYESKTTNSCETGEQMMSNLEFIKYYNSSSLYFSIWIVDKPSDLNRLSFEEFKNFFDSLMSYYISLYGSVNIQVRDKYTPFHALFIKYIRNFSSSVFYEKRKERYEYMIKELLLAGGDIDIKNHRGLSALEQCDNYNYTLDEKPFLDSQKEQLIKYINSILVPRQDAVDFIISVSDSTGLLYDVSNIVFQHTYIFREYEHNNLISL